MKFKKILAVMMCILLVTGCNPQNEPANTPSQKENASEFAEKMSESKELKIKEKVDTYFVDMTIDEIELSDELIFEVKGKEVGLAKKDGSQYIYIKGAFKNISTVSLNPQSLVGKAIVDDEELHSLNFKMFHRTDSISVEVDSLETVDYIIYTEITDERADKLKNVVFYFAFDDEFRNNVDANAYEVRNKYKVVYTNSESQK